MPNDLKLLPPPEKKVACSVLQKLGFSYRQIGEIAGVSKDSAQRYAVVPIPDDMRQFETNLNLAFKDFENVLAAKAMTRMDETIARARIGEALEVYKAMKGEKASATNVQINNIIGDKKQEYGF